MAQNQAYLFLVFSLTGVAIGVLFDFFRILRRTIKTSNVITYVEDVIFWILTGLLVLYNIWYFNNGEIRIFMFLGIILGVLIYMSTLSNVLINIFSKILQTIIRILEIPIKTILKILKRIMTTFTTFFYKIYKKIKNKEGNFENNGE